MLFLLNAQVLNVQAEMEALSIEAAEERRSTPSLFSAVQLAQRVIFAAGGFEKADPLAVRRIAATIALSSEANTALFVPALNARTWRDVATRLGSAPLTTMAHLWRLQEKGPLSAGVINRDVWNQVMIEVDPTKDKLTA
jgi:hypothetical protein